MTRLQVNLHPLSTHTVNSISLMQTLSAHSLFQSCSQLCFVATIKLLLWLIVVSINSISAHHVEMGPHPPACSALWVYFVVFNDLVCSIVHVQYFFFSSDPLTIFFFSNLTSKDISTHPRSFRLRNLQPNMFTWASLHVNDDVLSVICYMFLIRAKLLYSYQTFSSLADALAWFNF